LNPRGEKDMQEDVIEIKRKHKVNKLLQVKVHKRRESVVGWTIVYVLMTALVAFTALPILFMVVTSLKPINELFIYPPRFWVTNPTLDNFAVLFRGLVSSEIPFVRYVFNSIFVTGVVVASTVFISSMGAYSLTKLKIPLSAFIFNIIVAALMFSTYVTRIPTYLVVNGLGLIDTYWALIITGIAYPYNIFLMKQFIQQFPNELLESARIDGASEVYVFFRIVMPNIKPAWATLIVLSFVLNWNDITAALIYTSNQSLKVLPLAIQLMGAGDTSRQGALMAATLIMTAPVMIIFLIMQNNVLKTMVHSGIKS
jgi:ABC-type glycerol-3-phosphate transport system permease component